MSKVIDAVSLAREPEQTSGMLSEVFARVQDLRDFYPAFDKWLAERVVPGLQTGERSILIEYRQGQLAALAILKDGDEEKKLCCLRVLPDFEDRHGLGVRLFEKSFEQLGTSAPLLSVAEERLPVFQRLFDHFGFELGASHEGIYRPGRTEYAFNGILLVPNEGARLVRASGSDLVTGLGR
ncbi:GNAT family N-acetyltransferase [Burkholderia vietnamiensis]|nr:GNAT family N-acetyltransferase [Burkholderia vietnamiensis]